jgi:hypothetical protein
MNAIRSLIDSTIREATATSKREFQNFIATVAVEDFELLLDSLETTAKVQYGGFKYEIEKSLANMDPTF